MFVSFPVAWTGVRSLKLLLMKTPVLFLTADHVNDPIQSSTNVPVHASNEVIPQATPIFYQGNSWGYLQQGIISPCCSLFRYLFYMDADKLLHPWSKEAQLALVYLIDNDVPWRISGYKEVYLKKRFVYLFYFPAGAMNDCFFAKGRYHVEHFNLSAELLTDLARENLRIAKLLSLLRSGSPYGLMEMEAPLSMFAEHTLRRSIRYNSKTDGQLHLFLKARAADLLLDFIDEIDKYSHLGDQHESRFSDLKEKAWRAQEMIEALKGKKMKLADISHALGLTDGELQEGFKKEFGETVGQFQKQRRIERAQELLLEQPRLSMRKISLEIGYEDESSFPREFKKVLNMTPQEYRKRYNEQ